jgi:hypothetical protein
MWRVRRTSWRKQVFIWDLEDGEDSARGRKSCWYSYRNHQAEVRPSKVEFEGSTQSRANVRGSKTRKIGWVKQGVRALPS